MQPEITFLLAVLIISVVIHEVSHGYAAHLLGDPTARLAGRLTLNPLKHLDLFGSVILPGILFILNAGFVIGWAKPVPYNPYNLRGGRFGPAYVAAAGPAANLLLALLFGGLIRLAPNSVLDSPALALAAIIVWVNLLLAIFNLIPVPPLDGSKILFSLLPYRFGYLEAAFARYQLFILLFVIFVLLNTSLLPATVSLLFKWLVGADPW